MSMHTQTIQWDPAASHDCTDWHMQVTLQDPSRSLNAHDLPELLCISSLVRLIWMLQARHYRGSCHQHSRAKQGMANSIRKGKVGQGGAGQSQQGQVGQGRVGHMQDKMQ